MELFLELLLTVSLSLIITFLFIKLAAMQPTDTNEHESVDEAIKIDRFQWMPLQEEMIKLEEPISQGKSLVEFYNVAVVESKEGELDPRGDEDASCELEESWLFEVEGVKNGGERKSFEIEIESIGEDEEVEIESEGEDEKDEWIEIGRQDFEELLGNRGGSL